jgi:hypothetical protein
MSKDCLRFWKYLLPIETAKMAVQASIEDDKLKA